MKTALAALVVVLIAAPFVLADEPVCPGKAGDAKASFLCGLPVEGTTSELAAEANFIQRNSAQFKSGQMPAEGVKSFLARFERVVSRLGLSAKEKHGAVVRYMTGSDAAVQARPGQDGRNAPEQVLSDTRKADMKKRIGSISGAFGPERRDGVTGPATSATTESRPSAPVDYKALNAVPPATRRPVRTAGFVPEPLREASVGDFVSTYVSGMGEHANGGSDALISGRAKDPYSTTLAKAEHDQIMYRLVEYNTAAYSSRPAKAVMNLAVGSAATIAYNGPFGLVLGVKQAVTGEESAGLGLMGHWVVGLSEYVRGDKQTGRKHFAVGWADFTGDLNGVSRKISDDLSSPIPEATSTSLPARVRR